uniref:Uncharacterized protein n=1 Tax=Arundo donax TaxID=35708 RepID=A0A0A8ZB44_ARUDO
MHNPSHSRWLSPAHAASNPAHHHSWAEQPLACFRPTMLPPAHHPPIAAHMANNMWPVSSGK